MGNDPWQDNPPVANCPQCSEDIYVGDTVVDTQQGITHWYCIVKRDATEDDYEG